eukprot:2412054-Rhodomonas_salina.1
MVQSVSNAGPQAVDVEMNMNKSKSDMPATHGGGSAQLVFDSASPSQSVSDGPSHAEEKKAKEKIETVSLGQLFRFATAND